ncbi:MAG: hypothetical protein JRI68_18155 [Deltaproteobacteria bacterium]|nr:hypothetical protein [Deltaproteobacteria bacterium]
MNKKRIVSLVAAVEDGHISLCPLTCVKVEAGDEAELEVKIPGVILD